MEIGARIREARKRAVMTQAELAAAANVNRSALSLIEGGHKEPRPATIRKIAAALGVDPRDLTS